MDDLIDLRRGPLSGLPLFIALVALLSHGSEALATVQRADRALADAEKLAAGYPATVRFVPDGSGTLIHPRWVLTAAHVARGLSPFGDNVEVAGVRRAVAAIVFHPRGARVPNRVPEVDAALVLLGDAVAEVEPAALFTGDDEVGRDAVIVGYGDFARAGAPEYSPQDGARRAVTNRIDALRAGYLRVAFDGDANATALEGVSAPGDSGGGLYVLASGKPLLAGVSSFAQGSPLELGSSDHFARVSSMKDWIAATIRRHAVSERPVATPRVVGEAGFPDSIRGRLCRDLVAAFNAGPEVFRDFAARHGDSQTWARLGERRSLYGVLAPELVLDLGPAHAAILVKLGARNERRVINLFFDATAPARLQDVEIGMAKP